MIPSPRTSLPFATAAFHSNHQCDLLDERSQDAFTRAGEEIFDRHPDERTWEFLDQYAIDISDIDKGSRALAYLIVWKIRGQEYGVAAYAGSTHLGAGRIKPHIFQNARCVDGLERLGGGIHHYVYKRALELSDEPPHCIVIARDLEIDSELCFVEHLEAIIISMMDLCHSKDTTSLQIARDAQHSSLSPIRSHAILEGLNRLIPAKQSVKRLAVPSMECRNCNLVILIGEYRAHLDEKGDSRHIHIYQICDKDFKREGGLKKHMISQRSDIHLDTCAKSPTVERASDSEEPFENMR